MNINELPTVEVALEAKPGSDPQKNVVRMNGIDLQANEFKMHSVVGGMTLVTISFYANVNQPQPHVFKADA